MGFVRDKISDLKTNSTWLELRWNLACIQHEVDAIDRYNVVYDENDVRTTKDKTTKFYTGRAMTHIDRLWKA